MLKTRIIPTLLYKNHGLVKGIGFDSWRRVGTVLPAIKVYNTRQVDELILVDITASQEGRCIAVEDVDAFADDCFMPLTVGGGITSTDQIRALIRAGADKVSINSAAVANPSLVAEGASIFGAQCIVASIDVRRDSKGQSRVATHAGKNITEWDVVDFARLMEKQGAGEILLTSVERDGTMEGYDIDLIRMVTQAVSIPVIASGGAGNYEHMYTACADGGASAVAAASIFHFTEQTPLEAKRYLKAKGIHTRV